MWQYRRMRTKRTDVKTVVGIGLLLLASGAPAGAGRMFGTPVTASQTPDWCFCARVCQVVSGRVSASLVPPGQSLAICPQLHDEVIYDNMANCACPQGKRDQPLWDPAWQSPDVTSPNR
ncbi:MAG: hypothetical protein ACI8R4_002339 [Paracoccaceae bacterium]|jgi:hypothetical protein